MDDARLALRSSPFPTWRSSRTPVTVAKPATPDLMGLLAQAQAKATADNLVPLIGAIEAYLSDHERKLQIAGRLRELREASPYTQEGIAERIGVSLRGYQKMEQTGGVAPTQPTTTASPGGRWIPSTTSPTSRRSWTASRRRSANYAKWLTRITRCFSRLTPGEQSSKAHQRRRQSIVARQAERERKQRRPRLAAQLATVGCLSRFALALRHHPTVPPRSRWPVPADTSPDGNVPNVGAFNIV